jgi:putative long chain acyl-CoA synthase
MQVDVEGDYWFVDRQGQMIETRLGPVASTRIEDALYEASCVASCVAASEPDPDDAKKQVPIAAIQLASALDLAAVSAAVATLPEYARPRMLRVVEAIPLTDGFRPIKRVARELAASEVFSWDAHTQRYEPVRSVSHAI